MTRVKRRQKKMSFQLVLRQSWIFLLIIGLGFGVAIMTAFQPDVPTKVVSSYAPPEKPKRVASHTVARMQARFRKIGYDLSDIRDSDELVVPRVWSDSVPADMDRIKVVGKRKRLFVHMMLPLVLMANERIARDRQRLKAIRAKIQADETIAQVDKRWLKQMHASYKVKPGRITALLRRVDVVPPSLALAQAAIESGWGTSRFARKGNALFGQWTFDDNADGIVPSGRESGKNHRIKAFDSPLDSVAAYMHNLNTHRAYRDLRKLRAKTRSNGGAPTGMQLTQALSKYSEKGWDYVELLRVMIRSNDLAVFDKAQLANRQLAQVLSAITGGSASVRR